MHPGSTRSGRAWLQYRARTCCESCLLLEFLPGFKWRWRRSLHCSQVWRPPPKQTKGFFGCLTERGFLSNRTRAGATTPTSNRTSQSVKWCLTWFLESSRGVFPPTPLRASFAAASAPSLLCMPRVRQFVVPNQPNAPQGPFPWLMSSPTRPHSWSVNVSKLGSRWYGVI